MVSGPAVAKSIWVHRNLICCGSSTYLKEDPTLFKQQFPDQIKILKNSLSASGAVIAKCKTHSAITCDATGCPNRAVLYFLIDEKFLRIAVKDGFAQWLGEKPNFEEQPRATDCLD